jgi:hypothetical protein
MHYRRDPGGPILPQAVVSSDAPLLLSTSIGGFFLFYLRSHFSCIFLIIAYNIILFHSTEIDSPNFDQNALRDFLQHHGVLDCSVWQRELVSPGKILDEYGEILCSICEYKIIMASS